MQDRVEHDRTTGDCALVDALADEVEGAALPGHAALRSRILRVDRAHACAQAAGTDHHGIAYRYRPGKDGSRHDRSHTRKAEAPIHGQPKATERAARRGVARRRQQSVAQLSDPLAAVCRHRNDLRRRQTGRLQHLAHVVRHLGAPLRRHQIDLGQGDETARETEQIDYAQVLACLRHDAIVGGNDEQDEIDAGGAREHIAHEFLVPGNVDEAEDAALSGVEPIPKLRRGEVTVLLRARDLDDDARDLLDRLA